MSFIVRYQSDSAVEHEMFETLDEALARVERLHNDPSAAGASLFRQVPLKVQTVVKVMVDGDDEPITLEDPTGAAPSEPPPGAMPLQPANVAPPSAPADTGSEDSGKRRFSR